MSARLDVPTVLLFVLVVFPGLISIHVYRVIMPARPLDWTTALLQGVFYSTVNFILGMPVAYLLVFGRDPLEHPGRYFVAAALVMIVAPMLWPMIAVAALRSGRFPRSARITYPTVWDYFFDHRDPAVVLAHMNNGAFLAGLWGPSSYAGSFPNEGDLFLEQVYSINEAGEVEGPIPNTRGVLLQKAQYSYLEVFSVQPAKEVSDGGEE